MFSSRVSPELKVWNLLITSTRMLEQMAFTSSFPFTNCYITASRTFCRSASTSP